MRRTSNSAIVRIAAGWFVASLVLFLISYAAEFATLPDADAAAAVVRVVYRPVYLLQVPFHYLSRLVEFPADRHWPVWQLPVASILAPLVYGLIALGILRFARFLIHVRLPDGKSPAAVNVARRRFLIHTSGGAIAIAGTGTASYASVVAPTQLHVRHYDASIDDLPAAFDGMRLVQISDTHFGPFISMTYLESVVRRVNDLNPDFIALTGDYTHRSPRSISPGIGVFANLKARIGMAAVLGNHDHWEGANACRARLDSIGIPRVDNARIFLTPKGIRDTPGEGSLCIAGLGDLWEGKTDIASALDGVPENMPRIVLAHNPDSAELDFNGRRLDLLLCGHTHGGQISIPGHGVLLIPSRYGKKYAGGFVAGPHCPVIVSRGVGMTVMPIRFRVPPEIGVITLRRHL